MPATIPSSTPITVPETAAVPAKLMTGSLTAVETYAGVTKQL